MRTAPKLVLGATAAALALALGAAGVATAQSKKTLVFVVNGASDFWKIAEAGVKKAQGELPKYNLQFKYPEQAAAAVQQRVMDYVACWRELDDGSQDLVVSVDRVREIDRLAEGDPAWASSGGS